MINIVPNQKPMTVLSYDEETCHFMDLKGRKFEIRISSIIGFSKYYPEINGYIHKDDMTFEQFYYSTTNQPIYEVHIPELAFQVDALTSNRLKILVDNIKHLKNA